MKLLLMMSSVFLLHLSIVAQQKDSTLKPKVRLHFHSVNQFGVIKGEQHKLRTCWQTVNGITYKTWFAGLGGGFDYYQYNTLAAFVSVWKEVTSKMFLYADIGKNFPWKEDVQMEWQQRKFSGKLHLDMGFGFYALKRRNNGLLVSAGFSEKKLVEDVTFFYLDINGNKIKSHQHLQRYSFNRLLMKVGWKF